MEEMHGELVCWAMESGVRLSGVEPRMIPNRGTGMFATRKIKFGETLLVVPTEALRTLDNVPKDISGNLPPDISVHCLLALYLSLKKSNEFAVWSTVFPTLASFETSTPLMWPPELQAVLPGPAKKLLKTQQTNFQRDWRTVEKAFPYVNQEQYLHAWLLVNTRSFYYTTPSLEKYPHNDRLALLPIADLFNHADVGCKTTYSPQCYTFTADRAYRAGEEVHACYGGHSNDFLLTEYGFVLTENRWDTVCIDDVILPSLNKEQKDALEKSKFLGDYMLDPETVGCFRTQVALRMLVCEHDEWRQFADTEVDNKLSQRKVDVLLTQSLNRFVNMIQQTLEDITNLKVGQRSQRDLLTLRWKQIEGMVIQTIERRDE